jgi:hypothetical protein
VRNRKAETSSAPVAVQGNACFLRGVVDEKATVRFSWSSDGKEFHEAGVRFQATPGRWIGAKVGLYALGGVNAGELGYADYDWFRFER